MIFFEKEIGVSKVFLIEDNDKKAIEKIKEIGEWLNPPEPITYSDKISLYAYLYAYEKGLRDYDLTGFVTIISGLLTDMSASFGSPRKEDMEIENKAIDFLNSLEFVIEKDAPQRDYGRAKGVIHFVLNLYLDNQHTKLVKTTISLPESYIIKIKNSVEGSSFSDKCRNLIFDYFEKNEL